MDRYGKSVQSSSDRPSWGDQSLLREHVGPRVNTHMHIHALAGKGTHRGRNVCKHNRIKHLFLFLSPSLAHRQKINLLNPSAS